MGISLQGQREPVGHHDLVGPGDHHSERVELQEVPGIGGAVVAEDVDLELLGLGGLAELGREGEAALGDVVVPILPTMVFSAALDAGAPWSQHLTSLNSKKEWKRWLCLSKA